MLVPLSWLKEYVDIDVPPEELVDQPAHQHVARVVEGPPAPAARGWA